MMNNIKFFNTNNDSVIIAIFCGGLAFSLFGTIFGIGGLVNGWGIISLLFFLPVVVTIAIWVLASTHVTEILNAGGRNAHLQLINTYNDLPKELKKAINLNYKTVPGMSHQTAIVMRQDIDDLLEAFNKNKALTASSNPVYVAVSDRIREEKSYYEQHAAVFKEMESS